MVFEEKVEGVKRRVEEKVDKLAEQMGRIETLLLGKGAKETSNERK